MILWVGWVILLAEAGWPRMTSFTWRGSQLRWLGWLRYLCMCFHLPESSSDLFTWWQKFFQHHEKANSSAEVLFKPLFVSCLLMSHWLIQVTYKGWRNRCHLLIGRAAKYFHHFFQPTKGNNTKSSETKSGKFPWVLKPAIPKEKCQNGLQQDSLTICLVVQRVYSGGMTTICMRFWSIFYHSFGYFLAAPWGMNLASHSVGLTIIMVVIPTWDFWLEAQQKNSLYA